MIFKPSESPIYKSVRFQESQTFKLTKFLLPIGLALVPVLLLLGLIAKQPVLLVILALDMLALMPLSYFRLAFLDEQPGMTASDWMANPEQNNVALAMGSSAISVILEGEKQARKNNQPFTPYWLLAGYTLSNEGQELLIRFGMPLTIQTMDGIKIDNAKDAGFWQSVLVEAANSAKMSNTTYIEAEDLFMAMAKYYAPFQGLMQFFKLDEKAAVEIVNWHKRVRAGRIKQPFWLQPVIGGVGQDWSYGYTQLLQRYALNLTKVALATGRHIEIFSKTSVVEAIERILARSEKNNVLLVGESGVGKKTIIEALARKIVDGDIHPALRYKQIMQVNVGALLAGGEGQGEIVGRIEGILREAVSAGNIILFLEDFHALVSSKQTVGTINAAEVFMPYLQGSGVQIIGTTTIANYHEDIEAATGIAQAFEKLDVPEPSKDEALEVLEETIPFLEGRYGVLYSYPTLKEIVELADRYLHDKSFPQKAIDLADEAGVKASASGKIIVQPQDIEEIVSGRAHVPVGDVQESEREKLLKLENVLHKRVIGQNEAIEAVSNALRRARSGLSDRHRPIGTFLFIGPTGVGKTETAKALAEVYYGSEQRMIRFDMSEYQDAGSVYKLVGAPAAPGAEPQPGLMTAAVHDNPFSLVLLDELEKAHPNILTLFLQVFDDGRLTDSSGRVIDFANTIIIATSNAGSEVIREYLQSGKNDSEELKTMLLDFLQKNGIYRPEFLNRFDAVVSFRPLNQDEIKQIAQIMIANLNKQLEDKAITIEIQPDGLEFLVTKGYDPVFGARPLRRLIQDTVQNALAKKMLEADIPRGTVITLGAADLTIENQPVGQVPNPTA